MAFAALSILCLAALSSISAHPLAEHPTQRGSLFQSLGINDWAHPEDHHSVKLFRRQELNDTIPPVGTSAWLKRYPSGTPDVTKMPKAWQDALAALEASGKIPDIPHAVDANYPKGADPGGPEICSSAWQCRGEGDIWDAPDGLLGVSFDDGPTSNSPKLYDFLKQNNQRATHFFIGENIRDNPQIFLQAFNLGNDMASHTWSHRHTAALTNAEIVAELGWTNQIIHDMTGGRVPRYWRPPYGESDNRVRVIAKEIFGMVQVDWNQDTNDWELPEGKVTMSGIASNMHKWLTGPKSPGLIILEHELYPDTVQAFIDAYPLMKSNGWDTRSIPDLFSLSYYQNSKDNTDSVTPMNVVAGAPAPAAGSSTAAIASSTGTAAGSGSTSGSGSGSGSNGSGGNSNLSSGGNGGEQKSAAMKGRSVWSTVGVALLSIPLGIAFAS